MKYALIALFAIACSDSEEAAPTEAPVAEEKAEKKPNAPKDAGHDGAHGELTVVIILTKMLEFTLVLFLKGQRFSLCLRKTGRP